MRKYILGIALAAALMCGTKSYAQYNREYFFWVGRSCMMNNDYQEAIRTLNTLLRFDENAFEAISCAASPNTTSTTCWEPKPISRPRSA